MPFLMSPAIYSSRGEKCITNQVTASLGNRVWSETNFSEQWLLSAEKRSV